MASNNTHKREHGCKGDPRMHRAVAFKLANPKLSPYRALVLGGFQYARDDGESTERTDQVTLRQRKNNLCRRVRNALREKKKHQEQTTRTEEPAPQQQQQQHHGPLTTSKKAPSQPQQPQQHLKTSSNSFSDTNQSVSPQGHSAAAQTWSSAMDFPVHDHHRHFKTEPQAAGAAPKDQHHSILETDGLMGETLAVEKGSLVGGLKDSDFFAAYAEPWLFFSSSSSSADSSAHGNKTAMMKNDASLLSQNGKPTATTTTRSPKEGLPKNSPEAFSSSTEDSLTTTTTSSPRSRPSGVFEEKRQAASFSLVAAAVPPPPPRNEDGTKGYSFQDSSESMYGVATDAAMDHSISQNDTTTTTMSRPQFRHQQDSSSFSQHFRRTPQSAEFLNSLTENMETFIRETSSSSGRRGAASLSRSTVPWRFGGESEQESDHRMEMAQRFFFVEANALYNRCMLLAGYKEEDTKDTSLHKLRFAACSWMMAGSRLQQLIRMQQQQQQNDSS